MARHPFRILAHSEEGSISVLITSLFLLVFILSVGIIDISDSYLAKRELIQIGEDAILVASHTLNENLYYSKIANESPQILFDVYSEIFNIIGSEHYLYMMKEEIEENL